jgi:hypothetical protein
MMMKRKIKTLIALITAAIIILIKKNKRKNKININNNYILKWMRKMEVS